MSSRFAKTVNEELVMIGTSSMMTERTRGDSLKNKNCTIKTMNKSKARSLL